jgi:hypothetical protein
LLLLLLLLLLGAWGLAAAILAVVYPLIQISNVPNSQRVAKGRLSCMINVAAPPINGALIACLARTLCAETDSVTSTSAG